MIDRSKQVLGLATLLFIGVLIGWFFYWLLAPSNDVEPIVYKPIIPELETGQGYEVVDSTQLDEESTLEELTEIVEQAPQQPVFKRQSGSNLTVVNNYDSVEVTDADPAISMFYYGDFSDMLSKLMYSRAREFGSENKRDVQFVVRHYPLANKDFSSEVAVAIECIKMKGSDTTTDNILERFSKENIREETTIASIVSDFGVNEETLGNCSSDSQVYLRPQFHKTKGRQHGIAGAPSVVFQHDETKDVVIVTGVASSERLEEALEEILKEG